MNGEDFLKQLLSIRPAESQIAEGAARARRQALRRFSNRHLESPRTRRWPFWAFAAASLLLSCSGLLLWRSGDFSAPTTSQPASAEEGAAPPVKIMLTLDDGTRVIWTIDNHFTL